MQWAVERTNWHMELEYTHSSLPPSFFHVSSGSSSCPQVENFSDTAQLHGALILELKKKWPCQSHQGEHGQVGHCYVAPSGEHIRLNALCLKAWAAAIVCLTFSHNVTLLIYGRLLRTLPSMSPPISLHSMVPTMAAFQAQRLAVDLVHMPHPTLSLSLPPMAIRT